MKLGAYLADLCPSMPAAYLTTVSTPGSSLTPPRYRRTGLRPHQGLSCQGQRIWDGTTRRWIRSSCPRLGPRRGPRVRPSIEGPVRAAGLVACRSGCYGVCPPTTFPLQEESTPAFRAWQRRSQTCVAPLPSPNRVTHMCAHSPFQLFPAGGAAGPCRPGTGPGADRGSCAEAQAR